MIQASRPVDNLAAHPVGNGDAHSFDLGAFIFPVIQLEVTLDLEGRVEHALTGHDPAGANFLRRTLGIESDFESGCEQAQAQLSARLTSANDGDALHVFIIPSAWEWRERPSPAPWRSIRRPPPNRFQ